MEENNDDVIICRCEEVTLGDVKKAIKMGARNTDAVKRITRAGMGLCQNKTCYNLIAKIISTETGIPLSEVLSFTSRPPVRPIPVKNWENTFMNFEELANKEN
jgi:NAD(P)H-nitrite reductase large subunit